MGKTEQKLTLLLLFIILIGWTHGETHVMRYYSSYYGVQCDDACDTREKSYFWCNTKKGWDYCSAEENTDYTGQPCREDHPCKKYGKSYHWCYVEGGGWGYCGLLRNTAYPLLYTSSTYMSVCWDECSYDEKKKYFGCHTEEGWDYCSPLPDVTYKNEPCLLDHYCAMHGSSYTWCSTDSGSDKCGVINPGECKHVIPEASKKGSENRTVVSCNWNDQKSLKEIKFIADPDLSISTEGSAWKNEVINFIAHWKSTYLNQEYSSKMITMNKLRFDIQKPEKEKDQKYYNLQIMVNVYTQCWRSTKLAQVVIPNQEIPDRFVKLAFMESFRHRAKISVEII